jgi:predicted RNase H-like HicB family nuclease
MKQCVEIRPSETVLKQARKHISRYTMVIEPDGDGAFSGSFLELPETGARGKTVRECGSHLASTAELVVASLLTGGRTPPLPAKQQKLTENVKVFLTPTERAMLKQESARQGFRGIGDLIRAEMIRHVGSGRR